MIVLDTNVLSALMRNVPDEKVTSWLDKQPATSIWTTSITVLEVQLGLQTMPSGRKQADLSEQFEKLLDSIDHRIAVFDEEAARLAAKLTSYRQKKGRVGELRDTMIAGVVLARYASLATRNVMHFADIGATIINPWVA
jgi:predicted nucleic acid-binding protein